jgi:hypothetical protein
LSRSAAVVVRGRTTGILAISAQITGQLLLHRRVCYHTAIHVITHYIKDHRFLNDATILLLAIKHWMFPSWSTVLCHSSNIGLNVAAASFTPAPSLLRLWSGHTLPTPTLATVHALSRRRWLHPVTWKWTCFMSVWNRSWLKHGTHESIDCTYASSIERLPRGSSINR